MKYHIIFYSILFRASSAIIPDFQLQRIRNSVNMNSLYFRDEYNRSIRLTSSAFSIQFTVFDSVDKWGSQFEDF